jgi:hypothetical protein
MAIQIRSPYENKNDWIDFGALLFWSGIVLRERPEDGYRELERIQIKAYF